MQTLTQQLTMGEIEKQIFLQQSNKGDQVRLFTDDACYSGIILDLCNDLIGLRIYETTNPADQRRPLLKCFLINRITAIEPANLF